MSPNDTVAQTWIEDVLEGIAKARAAGEKISGLRICQVIDGQCYASCTYAPPLPTATGTDTEDGWRRWGDLLYATVQRAQRTGEVIVGCVLIQLVHGKMVPSETILPPVPAEEIAPGQAQPSRTECETTDKEDAIIRVLNQVDRPPKAKTIARLAGIKADSHFYKCLRRLCGPPHYKVYHLPNHTYWLIERGEPPS